MGIVIEDMEFDPALRASIADYVAARYVDPDLTGFRSYEPSYSRHADDYERWALSGAAMSAAGPSMAAAPPMPDAYMAAPSAPKRKAGFLDTASELVERVRESVTIPKRESKSEAIEEECVGAEVEIADDFGSSSPGDTVRFAPIRLEEAKFEEAAATPKGNLQDWLDQVDEPFSTTLLMLIDRKGLTDVDVYKRANMSRQLFSRIRSDALYRPAKKTVLALGIAMGLSLDELRDLLQRAGFALSHSSERDLIVEYFVTQGVYNLNRINEALYEFDQPLI